MKRLLIGLLLLATMFLGAQQLIYTNSAVIAWDAVMTLEDGSVIPPEDVISYEIFVGPENGITAVIGTTSELTYVVTLTIEGKYVVGVRALRYIVSADVTTQSEITWSNVEGYPEPWVLVYLKAPAKAQNVRVQ